MEHWKEHENGANDSGIVPMGLIEDFKTKAVQLYARNLEHSLRTITIAGDNSYNITYAAATIVNLINRTNSSKIKNVTYIGPGVDPSTATLLGLEADVVDIDNPAYVLDAVSAIERDAGNIEHTTRYSIVVVDKFERLNYGSRDREGNGGKIWELLTSIARDIRRTNIVLIATNKDTTRLLIKEPNLELELKMETWRSRYDRAVMSFLKDIPTHALVDKGHLVLPN